MKPVYAISLFSGTAQLDLGVKAALSAIGCDLRTVAFVEWKQFPRSILRARMQEGLIDAAPVWCDVREFPAARFAGKADAVVAGFPCQPFSSAGYRAGLEDERYLFGEVLRVADEAGCSLLFLENVPGLLTPIGESAPVSDVARLLAEGGFEFGWCCAGAADVGAPHGRDRWWCISWRAGDSERSAVADAISRRFKQGIRAVRGDGCDHIPGVPRRRHPARRTSAPQRRLGGHAHGLANWLDRSRQAL